jgi:DNA sulfur modification protein DndD
MRIDSIKIHNHRQLKEVEIRFPKPTAQNDLHVILAENGVGKTNILNAITWCLYGEELHLSDKKNALNIVNSQVVDEIRRFGGGTTDVTVELVLSTDEENPVTFKRIGTFNITPDAVMCISDKLSVTYLEDGGYCIVDDEELTNQLVHKYLPQEINSYIFFDGEQLESFFTTDQLQRVRSGINDLTQASYLQKAYFQVERYVKENINPQISKSGDQEVKEQQRVVDELQHQIELSESTLQTNQSQITQCDNKLSELEAKIHGYDNLNDKMEELKKSEQTLDELHRELTAKNQELMLFTREGFTLFALLPSVYQFYEYIKDQKDKGNLPPRIDKEIIDKILESRECLVCGSKHLDEDSMDFVRKLKNTLAVASKTSNELSDALGAMHSYFAKVRQFTTGKDKLVKAIQSIQQKIEDEEEHHSKVSGYLNAIPNNEEISLAIQQRAEFKELYKTLIGKQATESKVKKEREQALVEADKKLRQLTAKKEALKDQIRRRDFCEHCKRIMKETMEEVLYECRKSIEKETFEIFDSLIWKDQTFTKVEILEDYSFRLLDRYGDQNLGSCSAAERALLALSFTLALQDVSKHDSLLFIDTPIGRVGEKNRRNFMETLLKIAREKQIILTFTPTEYDANVQGILMNNYKSFHTLVMNDNQTKIQSKVL